MIQKNERIILCNPIQRAISAFAKAIIGLARGHGRLINIKWVTLTRDNLV